MADVHPYGNSISIMNYTEDNVITINDEEIDKLFDHPEVQGRKVVIFSLIGAFRGGKSFFLDYCLRFMYAHFASINNPGKVTSFIFKKDENWMGNKDEPLKGFSWRSGSKRDTAGILMWSDVFLHTIDRSGERIAIFVLDTQGLFDNKSTPTDNTRIFALGTLISSVQVINFKNIIQEDQLQYLQFATEFTKFTAVKKELNEKPFQHLTFLIRDFAGGDYDFGIDGGTKYFEEEVIGEESMKIQELQSVRDSITNAFEKIGCCLLPYPGNNVPNKNYNGCLSKMDEDFKMELKNVIEYLLLPENLTFKKIDTVELTCAEMKTHFKNYLKLFISKVIPKTETLYEQTVDSQLNNVIEKCLMFYNESIISNADKITMEKILAVHNLCKEKAIELFNEEKKMGVSTDFEKYKQKLDDSIEKSFENFKLQNEQNVEIVKNKIEKQKATSEKEKLIRDKAIEDLEYAKEKLNELEKMKEEKLIEFEVYTKEKAILEERVKAEESRTELFENKAAEQSILQLAISAICITAVAPVVGMFAGPYILYDYLFGANDLHITLKNYFLEKINIL